MSIYARRNPENTELLQYPLTARDLNQTGHNYGPDPQDGTLANSLFVLVREDAAPPITFGQSLRTLLPVKRADGHWYRGWLVVDPSAEEIPNLKTQLKAMAEEIASSKRLDLTTAHILTFMELDRLAADATPTAAEYPMLQAPALGRTDGGTPTTFQQAVTGAQNFRANWTARAALVERRYHEIIGRINAASTLAEARDILAELEDLV